MNSIFKFFWIIGSRFRNPSLKDAYNFLQKSQDWSSDKLLVYQFTETKTFLKFVSQNSPYYKKLFKEIGFDVESDFNAIEDLKKIPIVNKSDLVKDNEAIHTKTNFKKIFECETSGTSGVVLRFNRNEEWDSFNRASIMRGYSWYDVKPWEKNGYFWGYQLKTKTFLKTRFLDYLQNRYRIFNYSEEGIRQFMSKTQGMRYIEGYSSMIYEVAKRVNNNQNGYDFSKLKMIKGTSEKVYESYQSEVKKAFSLPIINEYGSAESGIIGFECPYGHIHLNMEGVVLEVVDGEAVVTNFRSRSFPIIRYKLGDYVDVDFNAPKCSCGRHTPIIKSILGRVGKSIYGIKETYPSLTLYYIFKSLALENKLDLNYQAVQSEKGKLDINIEKTLGNKEIQLVAKHAYKYFNNDVDFKIHSGVELHEMKGKMTDFITKLNN